MSYYLLLYFRLRNGTVVAVVEWKKCESIRNLHIYINPHTRCLKYGYEHSPAPTEHYVFESTAKLSNLGLATKIIPRYNTTVDK